MATGLPIDKSNSYAHITTNTTTTLRATGTGNFGILHSVTINNPGTTETITVNDGATAIAVIVPTVTTTLLYDVTFTNGLNIVTAGTTPGDYTICYQ
jgi:hypothetical protein